MSIAFAAVQTAIYETLTGDPDLMELAGVYDEHPAKEDAVFPYITIGDSTSQPWRTMSRPGYEIVTTLHVWSRYKGYKETTSILAQVEKLLAYQEFPVEGWSLVDCYPDDAQLMRDPDGITRHGVVRYRVRVLEGGTP